MGFVNRAIGAILALALIVGGALALLEVGAVVVGADPLVVPHDRWLADLSRQTWGERPSRVACVALLAAGLALIALQLLRQRPAEVSAAEGAPLRARVARRDLEREVAADLTQVVPGVATAVVKLRRKGFDVRSTVIAGDLSTLREQLAVATRQALVARGADSSGPVKVDVRRQAAKDS